MESKGKIFIVEDEWKIARFLQMELVHEGFITEIEKNGKRALERIVQEDFDVVLLDLMLPEMDGITICRQVREFSSVPIIMLTAKDAMEDKVDGLDSGADDYMTKPFTMPELFARIRAVRRKYAVKLDSPEDMQLSLKHLILDRRRREVSVCGELVELTKREYDLLEYLLANKTLVMSREQILTAVWGYDFYGDTNVVDVYIRYLRMKLDVRFGEKFIHTVRGVGYVAKD